MKEKGNIEKLTDSKKDERKGVQSESKKESMSDSGLTVEKLKQMGFHYPELALRVIDFIDHCTSVYGVKDLKVENLKTGECSCVNSYDVGTTETYRWKVLRVFLTAPDFPFSFVETGEDIEGYDADCLCFLNFEFIPTANEDDQFNIIWDADMNDIPLEKALEIHLKKEETAQPKKSEKGAPAPESYDAEGEQIRICNEGSSDEIVVNTTAACDDTAKAKDSDKEEATEKRPNDWWTQSIDDDIEFTQEEFEKAKAKQSERSEAPCDLQCAVSFCKDIFEEKCGLYGLSFIEMHLETLTDQLFMKATILKRRLTDRDKSERLGFAFFEGVRDEFAAVVNYGIIALRQSVFSKTKREYDAPDDLMQFYLEQTRAALSLICDKSADYGHLWRSQRIGTFADMIYTKVLRVKRIENQYRVGGLTKEDYHKFAGDQYRDMINYGLFGVVRVSDIRNGIVLQYDDEAEF